MADDLLIQIEGYYDTDPEVPTAYKAYKARRKFLYREIAEGKWATVILDSVTSSSIAARKWDEYVLNPGARGKNGKPDRWAPFNAATNMLEDDIYRGLSGLPCNVCIAAHIDSDKSDAGGILVYNPNAPGRLAQNLPTQFPEMYYAYAFPTEDKNILYALQTRNDGLHNAATQINVPNPCWPDYESLWANHEGERGWLHVIAYGAAGTMKSTLFATFPKPMLVLLFDGLGKEGPYLRQGTPSPWDTTGSYFVRGVWAP